MGQALIDFEVTAELERQIGRERLERVIGIQLSHGRNLIAKLTALGARPDPHAVRLLAHQIAGSSSSVGMTALGEAATNLESVVLSGSAVDLDPLVQELWRLGVSSHDALETEFASKR
jgi:HPt (histidine-containing phosphotransfer) domain-containing protein